MALGIRQELEATAPAVREALWQVPADMEQAKLLISKKIGLEICLGLRSVKLKPPIAAIRAQGRASADAVALLMA